jgi:hypothetical protein
MPEQRAVLADRLLPAPALDKRRQIKQMLAVPPQNPPQRHLDGDRAAPTTRRSSNKPTAACRT